jgi:ATP-dependent Lon protease
MNENSPAWNEKLKEVYAGAVVDKSLSLQQAVRRLPRFVSEWIVSKFCRDGVSEENLGKVDEFVRRHYPEKREKNRVLSDLMEEGRYTLIDEFRVETDVSRATYRLLIPSLDYRNGQILRNIVNENQMMLLGGVWGVGLLEYDKELGTITLVDFNPLQLASLDFNVFSEGRHEFTAEEWVNVLVSSFGLNPNVYEFASKIVLLSRIVPLVEPNVNVIELGPKGTGKTYLYRNVSYYSRIISGGQITPATLFYHLVTKTPGLLAMNDCIVFDEISSTKLAHPEEMIGKLKDYMESGNYDRGDKKVESEASIIMVGNIPVENGKPQKTVCFEALPKVMQDTAFLDRLNGFIPGWELSRIKKSKVHLTPYYGFAADFFCEICHEMRKLNFQRYIDQKVEFGSSVDIRDEKSIKKIASGMLKILFPDEKFSDEMFKLCIDVAVNQRQRIVDQLHIMEPGEFKKKKLMYKILS